MAIARQFVLVTRHVLIREGTNNRPTVSRLLGADHRLTDNQPVPYRCISSANDKWFVKNVSISKIGYENNEASR